MGEGVSVKWIDSLALVDLKKGTFGAASWDLLMQAAVELTFVTVTSSELGRSVGMLSPLVTVTFVGGTATLHLWDWL